MPPTSGDLVWIGHWGKTRPGVILSVVASGRFQTLVGSTQPQTDVHQHCRAWRSRRSYLGTYGVDSLPWNQGRVGRGRRRPEGQWEMPSTPLLRSRGDAERAPHTDLGTGARSKRSSLRTRSVGNARQLSSVLKAAGAVYDRHSNWRKTFLSSSGTPTFALGFDVCGVSSRSLLASSARSFASACPSGDARCASSDSRR